MLQHKSLLGFDPFSIEPEPQWINVHWLFQLLIAFVHSLGGYAFLTILKASVCGAILLAFAVAIRKHVGVSWLIVGGLAMLTVMIGRLKLRPEIFSLLFITLIISILDAARRGKSRQRLWLLTPIMLVWANMHGLYVIGLVLIWSAALADRLDSRLGRLAVQEPLLTKQTVIPLLAATAAVLVTPWPAETIIHPIRLWVRISGQAFHYTYGVSELRPTWQSLGRHGEAIFVAALTILAMAGNRKALPAAHIVWFAAMVALAALARRNVGLAGPVMGYLLAWHGQASLVRLMRRRPRWVAGTLPVRVTLTALVSIAVLLSTNSQIWRWMGWSKRFGPGIQAEKYPIAAARFLHDLPGKGDILCGNFGDASTFINFSSPTRRLYMDGRLEAHSRKRFIDYYRIVNELRTARSADKADLPETVRFIFVSQDMSAPLAALSQSRRFRLVYLDQAGACFARTDWHLDTTALPKDNLPEWRYVLDGPAASPLPYRQATWWARNPFPANYSFAAMLLSLGQTDRIRRQATTETQIECVLQACRYLESARLSGEQPRETVTGTLAQAYQQLALQAEDVPEQERLPVDALSARALWLYRGMDFSHLGDAETLMYAQQQVVAMQQARQIDAAYRAARAMSSRFRPAQQIAPPRGYLELLDQLSDALDNSRAQAAGISPWLPLSEQASRLTGPSIGLIELAISKLQAGAGDDPSLLQLLGDLLLWQGNVEEARQAYVSAGSAGADRAGLDLREALLLWVTGNLFEADARLRRLADGPRPIEARRYSNLLARQLGRRQRP